MPVFKLSSGASRDKIKCKIIVLILCYDATSTRSDSAIGKEHSQQLCYMRTLLRSCWALQFKSKFI